MELSIAFILRNIYIHTYTISTIISVFDFSLKWQVKGPRTEPWGIPYQTCDQYDVEIWYKWTCTCIKVLRMMLLLKNLAGETVSFVSILCLLSVERLWMTHQKLFSTWIIYNKLSWALVQVLTLTKMHLPANLNQLSSYNILNWTILCI